MASKGTEVFDFDQFSVLDSERIGQETRIKMAGAERTIRRIGEWPAEAIELIQEGHLRKALTLIFDDQPTEVQAVLGRISLEGAGVLINKITNAEGVTPGESAPSGASSVNTPST